MYSISVLNNLIKSASYLKRSFFVFIMIFGFTVAICGTSVRKSVVYQVSIFSFDRFSTVNHCSFSGTFNCILELLLSTIFPLNFIS